MTSCSGLRQSRITGDWYCPRGADEDRDCDECRAAAEHAAEAAEDDRREG